MWKINIVLEPEAANDLLFVSSTEEMPGRFILHLLEGRVSLYVKEVEAHGIDLEVEEHE